MKNERNGTKITSLKTQSPSQSKMQGFIEKNVTSAQKNTVCLKHAICSNKKKVLEILAKTFLSNITFD